MEIKVFENKIEFEGYPFPVFGKRKRTIYSHEIDFIKLQSDPISLCINSREILFAPRKYYSVLQEFTEQYKIKNSDELDAWELICYPLVDTHRTNEEMKENFLQLKRLSFEETEVIIIREKIERFISWYIAFSLEYNTLTHYDVLIARKNIYFFNPFWKNFYWYTMNIALRGYGFKNKFEN